MAKATSTCSGGATRGLTWVAAARQPSKPAKHTQPDGERRIQVKGNHWKSAYQKLASRRCPRTPAPRPITIPTPITIRLCLQHHSQNSCGFAPSAHANPDFRFLHRRIRKLRCRLRPPPKIRPEDSIGEPLNWRPRWKNKYPLRPSSLASVFHPDSASVGAIS